jgi:acyl carrier protein
MATDSTTVEPVVLDALRTLAAEPDAVAPDASLEQLDVDSLDLAEFAQVVDEELGVRLEGNDMKGLVTVQDVIDLIARKAE